MDWIKTIAEPQKVFLAVSSLLLTGLIILIANASSVTQSSSALSKANRLAERGLPIGDMTMIAKAESIYRSLLAANPNDIAARSGLCDLLRETNRIPEAVHFCQQTIAIDPTNADAHVDLARLYSFQGNEEQAKVHIDLALEMMPDHLRANRAKAYYHEVDGNHLEALRLFESVYAAKPDEGVRIRIESLRQKLATQSDKPPLPVVLPPFENQAPLIPPAKHKLLEEQLALLDQQNQNLNSELAVSRQQQQAMQSEIATLRQSLQDASRKIQQLSEKDLPETTTQLETELVSSNDQELIAPPDDDGVDAKLAADFNEPINSDEVSKALPHLAQLSEALPDCHIRREDEVLIVEVPARQLFQRDTAKFVDNAKGLIETLAHQISRQFPNAELEISSHADTAFKGTEQHATAQQLTRSQTEAFCFQLISGGQIELQDILAYAGADRHPIASNATPAGRDRNRRLEIAIELGRPDRVAKLEK